MMMNTEPTSGTWPIIAESCNPTGIMAMTWRAPSEHREPYPPLLPMEERAIWDLKSDAEVKLAQKVKKINEEEPCFCMDGIDEPGHWSEWWQRQALRVGEVWTRGNGSDTAEELERYDGRLRRLRMELVDEQLVGVRAREQAARDRAEANERRARMIGL